MRRPSPRHWICGPVAFEPTKWLRNPLSHARLPYEGRIDRNQFKISRIIHHRNSFLPTIIGSVRVDGTGAVIDATLRPHFSVIVFLALWCGIPSRGNGRNRRAATLKRRFSSIGPHSPGDGHVRIFHDAVVILRRVQEGKALSRRPRPLSVFLSFDE